MDGLENCFSKILTVEEAVSYMRDGITLMFGGFGGIGTPPSIIDEMMKSDIKNLTLIGNDTAFPNIGIGPLVCARKAKKVIVSHIGSNPIAGQLMTEGELDVEFSPQGTLVERIRAGGAGLGGILVDVGTDNPIIKNGKQTVELAGKTYLVETALTADIAIVYARKSDPYGNLVFDKSARNTNPLVAMAGNMTIAEVEEIVPLGGIDPDEVMTPGIFVDKIVLSKGVKWKWVWE